MSKSENIIDTKILVGKAAVAHGQIATALDVLARTTLDIGKSMKSADAPEAWRDGRYIEVAEYWLKDCQLTFDLYQYGRENGIVKSRSLEDGSIIELEVDWI